MSDVHAAARKILDELERAIFGKRDALELVLTCLLTEGHLLIEDLPGLGKPTLANAMARVLGLDFNRVQFPSDLLPADIVGVSVGLSRVRVAT